MKLSDHVRKMKLGENTADDIADDIKALEDKLSDALKEAAHQTDMANQANVACIGLQDRLSSALSDLERWQEMCRLAERQNHASMAERDSYASRLGAIRSLCEPFIIDEKPGKFASHSDGEIAEHDLAGKVLALLVERQNTK